MTGPEFHELLMTKWGRSYDVQLRRTQGKIFAQIMWKFWGQASYSRSQEEHIAHLEEVGQYIKALGAADRFRTSVMNAKGRPRIGKAISIALHVDLGDRASEWMLDPP